MTGQTLSIPGQLIAFAEDAPSMYRRSGSRSSSDPVGARLASVASVWEMAIKISIGKLILKTGTLAEFIEISPNQIDLLPVVAEDAVRVGELPMAEHKDPFDRLIAAQCLRQNIRLVSDDAAFDAYGVQRVW